jgi:hypothetical protein
MASPTTPHSSQFLAGERAVSGVAIPDMPLQAHVKAMKTPCTELVSNQELLKMQDPSGFRAATQLAW